MPAHPLLETDRLLAVAKPAGQLVIPGRGPRSGPTLLAEAQARAGMRLFVIHRLDEAASGVVLFAKDADTHRQLCGVFEARQVGKAYLALVAGAVERDGVVKRPLRAYGSGRMGVVRGGRPAVTVHRVLERLPDSTLLGVTPRTGKRHQIRVHLYAAGHPILGDPLYGAPLPVGGEPRLMLHALELRFDSPRTGPLTVRAEPPPDFAAILSRRRLTAGPSAPDSPA